MSDRIEDRIIALLETASGDHKLREHLDADLLEQEILNSLAFIEFLTELEDEYDIELQPTQIPMSTWRSVAEIIRLVKSMLNK